MKLRLIVVLLGLLWCALPMAARAQACSVWTNNTDMAFGTYDPTTTGATPATGNVTIICSNSRTVTIGLGAGSGSIAQRTMTNGPGNTLNYNLYKDAAYATIFGTNGAQTMTCTVGSNGSGCTGGWLLYYYAIFPVYGIIAPGQYVAAGSYSDNIPVTVTF